VVLTDNGRSVGQHQKHDDMLPPDSWRRHINTANVSAEEIAGSYVLNSRPVAQLGSGRYLTAVDASFSAFCHCCQFCYRCDEAQRVNEKRTRGVGRTLLRPSILSKSAWLYDDNNPYEAVKYFTNSSLRVHRSRSRR